MCDIHEYLFHGDVDLHLYILRTVERFQRSVHEFEHALQIFHRGF